MCLDQLAFPQRLPVTMPCMHTLCAPCAARLTAVKGRAVVRCPICRRTVLAKTAFTPNYLLCQYLEARAKRPRSAWRRAMAAVRKWSRKKRAGTRRADP